MKLLQEYRKVVLIHYVSLLLYRCLEWRDDDACVGLSLEYVR